MTFLLCDLDWYVHKPDVQNKWDGNTHAHTHTHGGQSRSWSAEQGKENKIKGWQHTRPPPTTHAARSEKNKNKNDATHLQALRRSRSVSRPYKDSFDSSTRSKGVASQNSTLPYAIISFPVSLLLSSPGDGQPRLPLISSTRP